MHSLFSVQVDCLAAYIKGGTNSFRWLRSFETTLLQMRNQKLIWGIIGLSTQPNLISITKHSLAYIEWFAEAPFRINMLDKSVNNSEMVTIINLKHNNRSGENMATKKRGQSLPNKQAIFHRLTCLHAAPNYFFLRSSVMFLVKKGTISTHFGSIFMRHRSPE